MTDETKTNKAVRAFNKWQGALKAAGGGYIWEKDVRAYASFKAGYLAGLEECLRIGDTLLPATLGQAAPKFRRLRAYDQHMARLGQTEELAGRTSRRIEELENRLVRAYDQLVARIEKLEENAKALEERESSLRYMINENRSSIEELEHTLVQAYDQHRTLEERVKALERAFRRGRLVSGRERRNLASRIKLLEAEIGILELSKEGI